ncbi:hypothetical protein COOONC_11870 [Cooperia oncophora]
MLKGLQLTYNSPWNFQFKSLFLGSRDNRWAFLERAVSYQKCLRAGGKHNDLERGRDLHHQTFFEMLGNWSFNNSYSKEDACRLAWYFLTDILNIDPSRLICHSTLVAQTRIEACSRRELRICSLGGGT